MNTDADTASDRYLDFSEDEEVVDGFSHGSYPEPWRYALSSELQDALSRRNPVTSVKQLLAFSIVSQTYQVRNLSRILGAIAFLLGINGVLIAVIIYLLINQ